MSSEILSTLLLEYDQKKRRAELDLENRKNELYVKFPRLQEIENDSIVYFCPNCGSKYDSLGELIGSEKIISKEENTISETKKIVDEKR